jgi:hypothetical protein
VWLRIWIRLYEGILICLLQTTGLCLGRFADDDIYLVVCRSIANEEISWKDYRKHAGEQKTHAVILEMTNYLLGRDKLCRVSQL